MKLIDITVTRAIPASVEKRVRRLARPQESGGPWFGAQRLILNPVVDGLFNSAVEYEGRTWPHYERFIVINRPHHVEYTCVSEATKGVE